MFIVPSPMPHFFFFFFFLLRGLGPVISISCQGFSPTINRVSNTLSQRVMKMKDGGCKGLVVSGTE